MHARCLSLSVVAIGLASCGGEIATRTGCNENTTRECAALNEHGRCAGQETCINGRWIGCTAVTPAAEACNGFDDNCDGTTDDAFPTLGDACDSDDSDECENGTFTCRRDGSGVECTNESVRDIADICNGLDDDCDGTADDDFPTRGEPCDGNDSDGCANGTWTCNAWGSGVECTNETTENIAEICNGTDDDCDGVPDGAEDLTRPCGVNGIGICTLGTETCDDDGAWTCDAVLPASEDLPDMAFADSNCDGVDGDLTRAVFVSQETGSDASTGCTLEEPCQTIMHALSVAAAGGLDQVLVQTGAYREVVDLSDAHDGISIYGGYARDWSRGSSLEPELATIVAGTWHPGEDHRMGVRARSTTNVAFQNLAIASPNAVGLYSDSDGKSSYAVHAVDSNLDFSHVVFRPGNGRSGLDGAGGSTPAHGADGNDGAADLYWLVCNGTASPGGGAPTCTCSSAGSGGRGGYWPCVGNATHWAGADGGSGNCAPSSGVGAPGAPNDVPATVDGSPGADGGDGSRGTGGNGVRLENGLWWTGVGGSNGGSGGPGCGGGGGGGGGLGWLAVGRVHGSGGGSGGCGGCGGGLGAGGAGGGSSVGIMALASTVVLDSCAFELGKGGAGGRGGNGAGGAGGGTGGLAGLQDDAGGYSGSDGGDGGDGGAGGGGGGGSGGNAFAVVSLNGSNVTERDVTVSGGSAGAAGGGGSSPGSSGTAGSPGMAGGTFIGDASQSASRSADTPMPIPDDGTAFSTVAITTESLCTYQVAVDVELLHESQADLRIEVVAPNGSIFVLHNHVPGTGDLAIFGEALTGQPLPQPATGDWVLRVYDTQVGKTGTLESWGLRLTCTI